jgi:hypothetical protein
MPKQRNSPIIKVDNKRNKPDSFYKQFEKESDGGKNPDAEKKRNLEYLKKKKEKNTIDGTTGYGNTAKTLKGKNGAVIKGIDMGTVEKAKGKRYKI